MITRIDGLPVMKCGDRIIAFKVNGTWFWGENLLKNARVPWIWSREFNRDVLL